MANRPAEESQSATGQAIAGPPAKLEGYGTRFPVLKDVFYIQSSTNPETKQTMNVLVKRGKELHAPDRMNLNPSQIILVEPVGPDSKVAQLIAEQKKQQ